MPESLPPMREVNPDVSSGVAEAISAAMALHPKDRPASVADWRQLFRSSISTAPMGPGQAASNDWPAVLRENWWLVGLAAWFCDGQHFAGFVLYHAAPAPAYCQPKSVAYHHRTANRRLATWMVAVSLS